MKTIYLKFTDKEEMYNVLTSLRETYTDENDEEQSYWKNAENMAIDEVGIIRKPTGETQTITDENGNEMEVPIYEEVEGYHCNILCRNDEVYNEVLNIAADYNITPNNPIRKFA